MAIQRINPASSATVEPIGSAATYSLANPLQTGLYRVTTDTTQTFTAAQLYVSTSQGFRFGSVVRGGQGYLSVPSVASSLTFTTGTFPLLVGFERFLSYNLLSAPTSVSFNYLTPVSPFTASISYSVPAGAASMGVYWPDGTFTGLPASATSASVTLPTAPTFGVAYPALVVGMDSRGVWGLGTLNPSLYNFAVFTSSGTYTPLAGSNTADVLVVGAGGGGATTGANFCSGGGGAGAVVTLTATPASASVAVTIGTGGTTGVTGGAGGVTTFGGTSASGGGGGGGTNQANGSPGLASGGGGRGASPATAITAGTGGTGTAPLGFAGGAGGNGLPNGYFGGGGGGGSATGLGAAGTAGSSGSPAPGNTHYTNITAGRGGAGGGATGGNFGGSQGSGGSTYGGGGIGGGATSAGAPGNYSNNAAGAGNNGVVIVRAIV